MVDFLERNQQPMNETRVRVIDYFIKQAGEKLAEITQLADELQQNSGCSFERALADALEVYKRK
jgi:hypothetical protein